MSLTRSKHVLIMIIALVAATSAAAQPSGLTAVVTTLAPIYLQPGAQTPLRVAKVGTLLKVPRSTSGPA